MAQYGDGNMGWLKTWPKGTKVYYEGREGTLTGGYRPRGKGRWEAQVKTAGSIEWWPLDRNKMTRRPKGKS